MLSDDTDARKYAATPNDTELLQYYGSVELEPVDLELQRQTADDALGRADDEQLVVDRLIGAASRKKLRTATSISHLAVLKSMNGSDCRTCTSKRESARQVPRSVRPPTAACANALLTR